MAETTDADRADAIADPRAGDVWRTGRRLRHVYMIRPGLVTIVTPKRMFGVSLPLQSWRDFTRHATLVRRGDA